tara:strand:+ start:427 stop:1107 length:681 start_codon:yes stop_codon:yes gene_type:complete
MGKIISEITRVREIMGVINEQTTGTTGDNSSVRAKPEIDANYEVKKPTSRQMAKELKSAWKNEVFKILDNIQEGDVFGFGEAYSLQKNDKLHAMLKMIQNLMCVNAKIARTVILAEDNVYDESKLMGISQFPIGGGHGGLINTIESNIKRLDKKFKLGRGGIKVDKKLRPIKKQLRQARNFIDTLSPYINWNEAGEVLGFNVKTTEDILINSKNLNKIHRDCANQI